MQRLLQNLPFLLLLSLIVAQEPTRTLAVLDFEPRGINSLEAATLTDRFTSEIGKTEASHTSFAIFDQRKGRYRRNCYLSNV